MAGAEIDLILSTLDQARTNKTCSGPNGTVHRSWSSPDVVLGEMRRVTIQGDRPF